ncbi:N-acetylmuramoyl-L-alanine amidase [Streptacidiphilus sp. EB129]|uniref:peptidoglycan recognition protein family protein n=1 Tax=Streptacidiphilus sp. EB129 TaxID=3156262 RepID=UPI0035134249
MRAERRLMLRRVAQVALVGGVTAVTARASAAPTAVHPHARSPERPAPVAVHWIAAQPGIVARRDWDTSANAGTAANLSHLPAPRYADAVKAAIIHHTDSGNSYSAHEVPDIIGSISYDQTGRRGWDDIGYNFLVDRFGTVYEGRHGGIDKPVIGAHCSGFNLGTVGIAAIGTFTAGAEVSQPMLQAISGLIAWKLSLHGVDPRSSTTLTCTDSLSRYHAGDRATLSVVSGHTDADCTFCPGSSLYSALPMIRVEAARIQLNTRRPVTQMPDPVLQPSPLPTACATASPTASPTPGRPSSRAQPSTTPGPAPESCG